LASYIGLLVYCPSKRDALDSDFYASKKKPRESARYALYTSRSEVTLITGSSTLLAFSYKFYLVILEWL